MNITSTRVRATDEKASRALLGIAANQASSVEVPRGAAVQCLSGKVWLTQEGDMRDHVVAAGTTFCTDRAGRVVMSAIETASVVAVSDKAARCYTPGSVSIDSVERFTRAAEQARAEYVAQAFSRVGAWMLRVLRAASRPQRSVGRPEGCSEERFRGFVRSL